MPVYQYIAINRQGQNISGTGEFTGREAAAAALRNDGLLVTEITESRDHGPAGGKYSKSPLDYISIITSADIVMFFRQLASLITAGVTLSNALLLLERQTAKRRFKKIIRRVREDIEGGASFRDALGKHPRVFAKLVLGMVQAGESSGALDVVLQRIASYLEDRADFRTQVISSFMYPSIVLVVSVVVVIFLVGFVIPKFVPIIMGFGGELPWNTQFLIDLTEWFGDYGWYLGGAVGAGIAGFVLSYLYVPPVTYLVDRYKLKIPVIGSIFRYSMVVQFARNLSTLIRSGVNLTECLEIVRQTVGNSAAKRVIKTMERRILRGEALSGPIRSADKIFPVMVADMVAVGEEIGNIDSTLDVAGDIHEKMLQTKVKRMNALIEPLMMIVLGGIVGFVAWALISGVLAMYGKASG